MDDITLALLGDHEAAERVTKKGVLLPCPWCKKTPTEDDLFYRWGKYSFFHGCKKAGAMRIEGKTRFDVCLAWNTRAPMLSAEEMERLEASLRSTS